MKILHTVESYYPSVGGMQYVVKMLSERMVKLGHDVTVATSYLPERDFKELNGVKIIQFKVKGNTAWGMKGNTSEYKDFLLNSDFDICTNFAAQQWATDVALPLLNRMHGKKVFVPTGFSGFYNPDFKRYFQKLKSWIKNYDGNIFLSEKYRDINFAKTNKAKNITVIPNAADELEFNSPILGFREKNNIDKSSFMLLHVGSHTGQKGHSELQKVYESLEAPNSTLVIIGNSFGGGCVLGCHKWAAEFNQNQERKIDKKRVIMIDDKAELRANTVSAYKEADIFIFPSNIECSPLVIFESMAAGLPFVASNVGNVKEIISWSNNAGLLLPTDVNELQGNSRIRIYESVQLLNQVIMDKSSLKEMSKSGKEAWQNKFTWEIATHKYLDFYKLLLDEPVHQSFLKKLMNVFNI